MAAQDVQEECSLATPGTPEADFTFLAFPEREKEGGSGRGKRRSRKSPETCEKFKMREEVRRNEVNKSWTSKRG